MMRFILPLVVFLVLAGFLYKGLHLDPHEVPSPLIDKPAPAFNLPQLHDTSKQFSAGGDEGQGLDAQCVVFLVRIVQGRASGADVAGAAEYRADLRSGLQGQERRRADAG